MRMLSELPKPKDSRELILYCAFDEIFRNGYRGASLNAIADECGLTKGAIFHYFPSKKALGLAVINEVLGKLGYQRWIKPLKASDDVIPTLLAILNHTRKVTDEYEIRHGSPLLNIVHETTYLDKEFEIASRTMSDIWRQELAKAIGRSRAKGKIQISSRDDELAVFILSSFAGAFSLARCCQSIAVWRTAIGELESYLKSLTPLPIGRKRAKPSKEHRV